MLTIWHIVGASVSVCCFVSVEGSRSNSQDLGGHFCMNLIISSGVMCWKSENLHAVMKAVSILVLSVCLRAVGHRPCMILSIFIIKNSLKLSASDLVSSQSGRVSCYPLCRSLFVIANSALESPLCFLWCQGKMISGLILLDLHNTSFDSRMRSGCILKVPQPHGILRSSQLKFSSDVIHEPWLSMAWFQLVWLQGLWASRIFLALEL